jgi:hypothetical protein
VDFAILDGAQELRLDCQAELPDLVEKQGALVGMLKEPDLRVGGAGECPTLMAEQLACEEPLDSKGS